MQARRHERESRSRRLDRRASRPRPRSARDLNCRVCLHGRRIISKELQKRVAIVSSGSSADTLLKLAEPELIPCISPGGRCAAMPRSVAAMHGFDTLNVEQLAALMVNRPEAFGSRAAGAYAIAIEAQGQGSSRANARPLLQRRSARSVRSNADRTDTMPMACPCRISDMHSPRQSCDQC